MQRQPKPRNVLRDKGESTEFQILLEVLRAQPHVKQKDVADAVGITVQAVSKHFKKLAKGRLPRRGLRAGRLQANPEGYREVG